MTWTRYPTSARALAVSFALLALAGCGSNDSADGAGGSWLDEHAQPTSDKDSYPLSLGAAAVRPLGPGQYLLLDAAPQCDRSRLGLAEPRSNGAREVIENGALGQAPMALCACSEFEASNQLPAGAASIEGTVGVNDEFLGNAPIQIRGALLAPGAVRVGNTFEADELRTNGTLSGSQQLTIHGDAVAGWLALSGKQLLVAGSLTVPEGTDVSGVDSAAIAYAQPSVATPCNCGADVDYDALRSELRASSAQDDASRTEAIESALSALDRDREIYLGSGRYYFSSIDSSAAVTIHTYGSVQIFVDGDLTVAGALRVVPERDSQLSLYVAGRFAPGARVSLAETAKPDALRLYVRDQVQLSGPTHLNGSLFAPRASFIADDGVESSGALFAKSFDFNGPLTIEAGPRFTGDACLVWNELDGRAEGESNTPATGI
jgi:hypothetical protein